MNWLAQCRKWVKDYDPVKPEMHGEDVHHYSFMRRLSEALPSNAIIVSDTGGNAIMMGHCFRSKTGQRIFSSNGNSPMGFAMAGAIGAWFAAPERPVIAIIGDGGMQLNVQELQTIKHYGCKVKVFVINNRILGNTKSYQRVNGKAELACGPDGYSAPNFSAIANAYGIFAVHVDLHCGNRNAIDTVLEMDEAVVCDVIHEDYCTYEPRMSRWDSPVEEMYPLLSKSEFVENMATPPWEGWKNRR